jgi:beta-N-acetylhexosaminidase
MDLGEMSIEEKIGQMLMVGFEGTSTDEVRELIEKYHVGGVILFARNLLDASQIINLCNELQELAIRSKHPLLFISIDQEGGLVIRIRKGATVLPGNMALGATQSPEFAYEAGKINGIELSLLGINVNLAPVLDVNNNPDNPSTGTRSFGGNPHLVAELGVQLIRGMQKHGVSATAKHFPGKGDVTVNSHIALPTVYHDLSHIEQVELYPFRAAISENVHFIMVSHVAFPVIDPTGLPATLSYQVITNLLKKKLKFKGLVITDDLEMGAIQKNFNTGEAAKKAVLAGADIILVCHRKDRQLEAFESILSAVRDGEISEKIIDESVSKILNLKKKIKIFKNNGKLEKIRLKHEKFAKKLAQHAVTVFKDEGNSLPLKLMEEDKVLLINPDYRVLTMVEEEMQEEDVFFREVKKRHSNVVHKEIDIIPSDEVIEECRKLAEGSEVVIIITYNAKFHPEQAKLVNVLSQTSKPIVAISVRNPYDLMVYREVPTYLSTYSFRACSLEAAVEVLFGEIEAKGKLPVVIPEK